MFKNIFIIFGAFYKNVKRVYIACLIFTILLSVLTPLQLMCIEVTVKNIYDRSIFIFSLIAFVFIELFITALSYFSKLCLNSFEFDGQHAISEIILNKVSLIDYSRFDNAESNAKMNTLRYSDKFITKYFTTIVDFLRCIVELSIMILYFLRTLNVIVILMVVFVVIDAILFYKSIKSMNEMFDSQNQQEVIVSQIERRIVQPTVLQFFTINNALNFISSKLDAYIAKVLEKRLQRTYHSQHAAILGRILRALFMICFYYYILFLLSINSIDVSSIIVMIVFLSNILLITEDISVSISHLVVDFGKISIIAEFIGSRTDTGVSGSMNKKFNTNQKNNFIEFLEVSFKYPNGRDFVLNKLSFTVRADQRTALIGYNGSGKSTVMKLLLRLYKPNSGKILLLGRDIDLYPLSFLYSFFGVVFQDFAKFEISIRDNMSLGKRELSGDDEGIRKYLQMVGLQQYSDIDAEIGKLSVSGINFSGGQWQRLINARVLFMRKNYILFDEALSSLDPIEEANMYVNLRNLISNKGSLIISHRMGAALMADRVIVMSNGQIVQDGENEVLIREDGLYKNFYITQKELYNDYNLGH
ncbi:MAG: ABC transporter ATP-binding protein/permease [Clostridiales bacterium]|nr:ABC transporter ATP-binding protein/permease [Clostridiales bacterium]